MISSQRQRTRSCKSRSLRRWWMASWRMAGSLRVHRTHVARMDNKQAERGASCVYTYKLNCGRGTAHLAGLRSTWSSYLRNLSRASSLPDYWVPRLDRRRRSYPSCSASGAHPGRSSGSPLDSGSGSGSLGSLGSQQSKPPPRQLRGRSRNPGRLLPRQRCCLPPGTREAGSTSHLWCMVEEDRD